MAELPLPVSETRPWLVLEVEQALEKAGFDFAELDNAPYDSVGYWTKAMLAGRSALAQTIAYIDENGDLEAVIKLAQERNGVVAPITAAMPPPPPTDFAIWDSVANAASAMIGNDPENPSDLADDFPGEGPDLGDVQAAAAEAHLSVWDRVSGAVSNVIDYGDAVLETAIEGMEGFGEPINALNDLQRAAMPEGDLDLGDVGQCAAASAALALPVAAMGGLLTAGIAAVGTLASLAAPPVLPMLVTAGVVTAGNIAGNTAKCIDTARVTEELGNQVPVVSHSRGGEAVRSYMRARPKKISGPALASLNRRFSSTSLKEIPMETDLASTSFGAHAPSTPPHMLTDVEFELVRLDERTPDGRKIMSEGFGVRELPLSFSAMFTTAHGQPGTAEIVGSIDAVTIDGDGRVWGQGWLLDEPVARRAGRLIQAGALRGNSVELSASKTALTMGEDDELLVDYHESKLVATTLVANPAMESCTVTLMTPDFDFGIHGTELSEMMQDQLSNFTERAPAVFTTATVLAPPDAPSHQWFEDPRFAKPTPISVDGEQVFGHLALWDRPHLGNRMAAPNSENGYAYFATGEVVTDHGLVPTGRLVIGGDHPALQVDWRAALDHYAATSLAWADVSIGEDEFGIWVAGMVRPGVESDILHAARASAVSGDWRRIGGRLELVAILSVNTPGFPVPRAFNESGRSIALTGIGNRPKPSVGLMQTLPEDFEVIVSLGRRTLADQISAALRAEMVAEAKKIQSEV